MILLFHCDKSSNNPTLKCTFLAQWFFINLHFIRHFKKLPPNHSLGRLIMKQLRPIYTSVKKLPIIRKSIWHIPNLQTLILEKFISRLPIDIAISKEEFLANIGRGMLEINVVKYHAAEPCKLRC